MYIQLQRCSLEDLSRPNGKPWATCVSISGALVHVLHRPAAAIRVAERVQWGHQVEYVQRHHLPEPDVYNPAHQLQQLQAANEQQGLDLWQVQTLQYHFIFWELCLLVYWTMPWLGSVTTWSLHGLFKCNSCRYCNLFTVHWILFTFWHEPTSDKRPASLL